MKALLFLALFAVETAIANPIGVPEHFEKNGDVFIRRSRTDICLFDSSGITWQAAASSARMNFVHARPRPVLEGFGKFAGRVNYLTGSNPLNWKTSLESYAGLRYQEIYPRIGLEFHGAGEELEYDFTVAPFADPSAIRIRFSGGAQVRLDKSGDLLLGAMRHHMPLAYQIIHHERRAVSARFLLTADGDVRFAIGKYDHRATLVIDPVVTYDKIISGTGFVSIVAMTVDAQGNVYVAGNTNATDLPATPGAIPHQAASCSGRPGLQIACQQMFVAKLNPDSADFAYLTYVDGTGSDFARGLAVDASGNAYLAGSTTSQDFPTTPGAFQTKPIVSTCTASKFGTIVSYPCNDAFALKLNPAGSALVYSTLLGGGGDDEMAGVRVDARGNVWLAGYTTSTDFPTTAGAFQTKLNGTNDSFVARLNTTGTALLESTLLGGSGTDQISALAIDQAGNAYVAGITTSSDFPTTAGAFQTNYSGAGDAFVAKFGPDSTTPIYATYYGSGGEIVSDIQADAGGNAYLGGSFPLAALSVGTGNPFAPSPPVTLAKIDPQGSSVLFQNSSLYEVSSLSVDSQGRVTAVGTASFNAPVSSNALSTCSSPLSPFLLRLEADGETVSYGSYTSSAGPQFLPVSGAMSFGPVSAGVLVATDASDNVYLATGATIEKQDFSQDPPMAATCVLGYTESYADVIAPGEIINLYGRNLGPAAGIQASFDSSGRLPFSLGGVSVTFDGTPAPVWYAQANQINVLVPFKTVNRTSTKIEITYNGVTAPPVVQPMRPASNIILATNNQIVAINQDGSINSSTHPAQRGSIVTIFSDGGGQTNPQSVDGEIMNAAAPLVLPVQILMGFSGPAPPVGPPMNVDVLYAGSAPGQLAGVVQINFVVPANLPPSGIGAGYPNQDVALIIGTQQGWSAISGIYVAQ